MKMDKIVDLPVIETERFTLRPIRKSDAGLISLYAGDDRVANSTQSTPHPLPPGWTEAFIARMQDPKEEGDVWVMDGAENGLSEVLGLVVLDPIADGRSEIGYWVAPVFWNTGIASEAVSAILSANPQNCDTIFASVFQDNPGSASVLTNAGFEYIGDAEAFSVARNATVPTWTYLKKLR